jgi:hypothetical protein
MTFAFLTKKGSGRLTARRREGKAPPLKRAALAGKKRAWTA